MLHHARAVVVMKHCLICLVGLPRYIRFSPRLVVERFHSGAVRIASGALSSELGSVPMLPHRIHAQDLRCHWFASTMIKVSETSILTLSGLALFLTPTLKHAVSDAASARTQGNGWNRRARERSQIVSTLRNPLTPKASLQTNVSARTSHRRGQPGGARVGCANAAHTASLSARDQSERRSAPARPPWRGSGRRPCPCRASRCQRPPSRRARLQSRRSPCPGCR